MMLFLFKMVLIVLAIFAALSLACAVWLALRREGGIGSRRVWHPGAADPFDHPFGEIITPDKVGFSLAQLDRISRASQARIAADPLRRSFVDHPAKKPVFNSASAPARRNNQAGEHSEPSGMLAGRRSLAPFADAVAYDTARRPGRRIFGRRIMP